ncbi:MAG: FAD-binding protein [Bacteroidales bacterium]|nr:FAD-binding protein [Bacteroidales bacterium]
MKKFALIGNPISHSKSPALFHAAYPNEPNIEPMFYDLIEKETIEESVERLKQGGYLASNVTAPYKEEAMRYVTAPSNVCKLLQAGNLLLFKEEGTYGFNTDYLAVRRLLQDAKTAKKFTLQDPVVVLVVGCGGAGKAAALAAKDEGLNTLITNRGEEKALNFARSIGIKMVTNQQACQLLTALEPANTLVIYALPQKDELLYPLLLNLSTRLIGIIEANYKNPCLNPTTGRKWLLYQAVEGFRLMTGMTPNLAAMREVLNL